MHVIIIDAGENLDKQLPRDDVVVAVDVGLISRELLL